MSDAFCCGLVSSSVFRLCPSCHDGSPLLCNPKYFALNWTSRSAFTLLKTPLATARGRTAAQVLVWNLNARRKKGVFCIKKKLKNRSNDIKLIKLNYRTFVLVFHVPRVHKAGIVELIFLAEFPQNIHNRLAYLWVDLFQAHCSILSRYWVGIYCGI